jgi:hypothetical protein
VNTLKTCLIFKWYFSSVWNSPQFFNGKLTANFTWTWIPNIINHCTHSDLCYSDWTLQCISKSCYLVVGVSFSLYILVNRWVDAMSKSYIVILSFVPEKHFNETISTIINIRHPKNRLQSTSKNRTVQFSRTRFVSDCRMVRFSNGPLA